VVIGVDVDVIVFHQLVDGVVSGFFVVVVLLDLMDLILVVKCLRKVDV
tara:strand:+ start:380 stop:523 length:144 start_codon:yes stop_codon:yes gene_type:complete